MKKCDTSELLKKFKIVHNNFYEYVKSDYINLKTKMRIKCPVHGYFYQRPDAHRRGQGCKKCSIKNKTIDEDVIRKRMGELHNFIYTYDLSNYKNSKSKIDITCKGHGVFTMSVSQHLKGYGCSVCAGNNIYYNNIEENILIDKLSEIYNDKYEYPHLKFEKQEDIIDIYCKKHGTFSRSLISHLRGSGCRKCFEEDNNYLNIKDVYNKGFDIIKSNKKSTTYVCDIHGKLKSGTRYFIEHGCSECKRKVDLLYKLNKKLNEKYQGRYVFNDDDYVNYQTPLLFYDRKRKLSFSQSMSFRMLDRSPNMNTDIFKFNSIKRHGDLYNYRKSIYNGTKSKIIITCKEHGDFIQIANNHLMGSKCPKCVGSVSYKESEVFDFIKKFIEKGIVQNDRSILDGKELDIYIPSKNLAIEYNGLYWHNELYKEKDYHLNKTEGCVSKDINLFHIWEDDWNFKQDIVKSMLLNKIGETPNKIYARKTEVREFTDTKLVSKFLDENHLQGKVGSNVKLGLFYNDELVSLMTFGKLRKNLGQKSREGSYEMLRFCNKKYTNVVGGASKLFKHFVKKYKPKKIISYASRDHSNGNLYRQLGFKLDKITEPGYHYIINNNRKGRFNFRKDKLVKEGYDPNKTEHEIMLDRDYYRIYNTGNYKFIYTK